MKHHYYAFSLIGAFMGSVLALAVALPAEPSYRVVTLPSSAHSIVKFSPKEEVLVAAYRHGWMGKQWACLSHLIELENRGFNPVAKNSRSSATGIFQMITSPSGRIFRNYTVGDQARLGTAYIRTRYGTPCQALTFHIRHNFY